MDWQVPVDPASKHKTAFVTPLDRVLWSPACQDAFDKLKKDFSSDPVLTSPDFDKPFVIQTDASNVGINWCSPQPVR